MRNGKDTIVTRQPVGAQDPKLKDSPRDSDDKRVPNPMDEGFVYYEE